MKGKVPLKRIQSNMRSGSLEIHVLMMMRKRPVGSTVPKIYASEFLPVLLVFLTASSGSMALNVAWRRRKMELLLSAIPAFNI